MFLHYSETITTNITTISIKYQVYNQYCQMELTISSPKAA